MAGEAQVVDPGAPPGVPVSPPWLRLASRVFTPLAVLGLLAFAWVARDTLAAVLAAARLPWLLLAVAVWTGIQLLVPAFAHAVLSGLGAHTGWRVLLRSHGARIPARYLPGGIWHTVGRVADLVARGVPRRALAALVILEQFIALGVTAVAGGALLLAFGHTPWWTLVSVAGCVAGALGLLGLRRFVNARVLLDAKLPRRAYARALLVTAMFWCGAATAFVCYLQALPGTLPPGGVLQAAGIYLLAWAVGFVAIFAPQGIGVFELVAGDLLQVPLSMTSVAVLVAGFRGVVLAGDVIVWLIARALAGSPCAGDG